MPQPTALHLITGVARAVANRLSFFRRSREAFSQVALRAKIDVRKWTPELLKQLEWRRFEELCVAYYQALGFTTRLDAVGADGSIDIILHPQPSSRPTILARCKVWNAYRVGTKAVQELRSSMGAAKVAEAVLLTSGRFTQEALNLAGKEQIEMIDATGLIGKIGALPAEQSAALLKFATQGDFITPTCPRCSVKMIARQSTKGGRKFWGCRNYPQCKQTFFASAPG